jgi:hypothetical protein
LALELPVNPAAVAGCPAEHAVPFSPAVPLVKVVVTPSVPRRELATQLAQLVARVGHGADDGSLLQFGLETAALLVPSTTAYIKRMNILCCGELLCFTLSLAEAASAAPEPSSATSTSASAAAAAFGHGPALLPV